MPDWSPPEPPLSSSDVDDSTAGSSPNREGLPANYRMRHDRHYVDSLESRTSGVVLRTLPTSQIEVGSPATLDPTAPLVESVRQLGVLQPVLVRRVHGGHVLIAGRQRLAAAIAAGLAEIPCRVYEASEQQAVRLARADNVRVERNEDPAAVVRRPAASPVLDEIADSLRAASACWELCPDGSDRPYAPVMREVTRIELQRVTWLVQALRLLDGQLALDRTHVALRSIVQEACRTTQHERRVLGISLSTDLGDDAFIVEVDPALVRTALHLLLGTVLAVVRSCPGSVISVGLARVGDVVRLDISQVDVGVTDDITARFGDVTWSDRPGGRTGAVYATAAHRILEAHGGQVTAAPLDPRGLLVRVVFP